MTLDIYADVDPDAKKAAVSKVEESFDLEFYDAGQQKLVFGTQQQAPQITFTEEQLLAMLELLRAQNSKNGGGACA